MTAVELQNILLSPDFQAGLEEMSLCLASIMQEGPIVHLLAKSLWKQKHLYSLERHNRHDLTVWSPTISGEQKPTTLEFKFNYETCAVKLKKELVRFEKKEHGGSPKEWRKGSGFDVIPRIWKDVCVKKPDLFVWIICSRDLSNIPENNLNRFVSWWKPLQKYRVTHTYKADREYLSSADSFLQKLSDFRPFSVVSAEVETNGDLPSIYHFRICEFK